MSSIYFDRPDGKSSPQRAHTHVDYATAKVGNRWLERSWSRFMGTTNSLLEKEQDREWVAVNNPEFRIELSDCVLGPMELGDTDFSDTVNELGAVLTLVKSNDALTFTVQTIAFHDMPVMIRQVSLANRSDEAKLIRSISLDAFKLESDESCFLTQFFSKEHSAVLSDTDETTVALEWDRSGFLVGRTGEAIFDLGHSAPGVCEIRSAVEKELSPGETLTCERTLLMPYGESPLDFANKQIPQVMNRLKAFETSELKKEQQLKEEESE